MRTLIYTNKLTEIEFRPINMSQVDDLYTWSQDREFCFANDWPRNQTIGDISSWWEHVIQQQSRGFKRQAIYYRDIMIGYFDIVHHEDSIIELGIAIGHREFRKVGLGTLIFSKITKEASIEYPGMKIIAITQSSNIAAQRMMIKSGYMKSNGSQDENKRELTFCYIV